MNTILKRVISLMLCFVLIVGYVPVSAFATESGETVTTEATDVTTAPVDAVSDEPEEPSESTEAVEPSDETTAPSGEATEPSTEATEPSTEATEPSTEATEPSTEATEPSTEATEPTEDTTEPTEAPKKVVTRKKTSVSQKVATTGEDESSVYVESRASSNMQTAAIFFSDVHEESTSLTGSGTSAMKSVLSTIGENGVSYETIGLVGDTYTDIAGTMADMTSAAQTALGQNAGVYYAYGDHDEESDISPDSGLMYSGDHYYIYHISDANMRSKVASQSTISYNTAISNFKTAVASMDKSKVLFIMSHVPLHDRRDDNTYANDWYSVIEEVAATMDVVVFWAHNHTSENETDEAAYYVAKDGSETFTVYGGSAVTPGFTYMNAGYIYAAGQNPSRKGVATTVEIYADKMVFQDYNSSGEYTDSSNSHNVSVEREFATSAPSLSSIAISGTTEYTVGDALDLTVTATYSDGTTKDVTADATITGHDMNTAGSYTVTATYGEKTATASITVKEAVYINSISVTTQPTKLTYTTGEELDTTGMVVTATYSDGTTAEVTGWYTSAVDMTTAGEKEVTVNYAVNGITFQTTFAITVEQGVAEGLTLQHIEIKQLPTKTEYLISEELNLDGLEVSAYFSDGTEGAEETEYPLSYAPFTKSAALGGYTLDNFSMYVEKDHKVTVSYTYGEATKIAEFIINVWNEDFADETSGVSVSVAAGDYGVTAVSVANSENTNVATAIADVISGTGYKAYDITLTLDEEETEAGEKVYALTEGEKTVTLPIPEGVTNPVVYYVSDDGQTVTNMNAAKTEDGESVSFTTTHFSTYVVGNGTITGKDEDATVEGGSSVTKVAEEVTVYKLVTTPVSGKQYLIVNSNTGAGYGLDGDTTGYTTTTFTGGSDYYSTWDDTAKTGIAFAVGSDVYLTTSGAYLWTAGSDSFNIGYDSTSENHYGLSSYTTYEYALNPTDGTSGSWALSDNKLSISLVTKDVWLSSNDTNTTYQLYNSGSTWSMATGSGSNVYFYEPVTVYKVTEQTTGTQTATYGIDITLDGTATQGITASFVKADETKQLGTAFTSTVEGQAPASGGTYTWTSSNKDIATVDANGLVEFTGKEGETLIQATYTWTENGNTYSVSNYVSISVTGAIYDVEISQDGTTATPDVIAQRNVQDGTTLELKALTTVQTDETTTTAATPDTTTWYAYLEDGSAADFIASIDQNGKLTFTGEEGTIKVMVACKFGENTVNDIITINVRKSNAVTPDESTTDFPRWPNEGAVRYDKTAQAVGNFSNTGVAQVELSMAGIPQKSGGAVDVVLMLDMTGSMNDDEMAAAEAAAKVFVDQIVKNSDDSFNNSRIAIYAFNSGSSSPYELWAMSAVTTETYDDLTAAIESASTKKVSGGTPYDEALNQCRTVLQNTKIAGRKQFCVFVSDGAPTQFEYITGGTSPDYTTTTWKFSGDKSPSDDEVSSLTSRTEYYSTMMKEVDDVTVYTVGTGLTTTSDPNALEILENIATDSEKAYVVASASDTTGISNAFTAIAEEIKQAASQIEVSDKITEEYEMIFQWPDAVTEANKVSGQEFYIEVVNYELDATSHERNGTYDVLTRVYLTENADGTLAISKLVKIDDVTASSAGTTTTLTTTPAYTAVEEGKKGYFNLVDGTYVYVADGTGGYNMTEGATVSGSADTVVLHTPYFSYVASTKVITWHITETAENSEIALRYFLYLTGSLESVANKLEEGDEGYVAPGTYPTNDYATLEYKNYKGNDCLQYFPEPQLTWNGAQVSYVFYLVNSEGKPVNTAGREVKFSEAVFVTSIHTEAVVWNEATGTTSLNATKIAGKLLPDSYKLYDATTQYEINVYMDESDHDLGNHFVITAGGGTTMVYNTKAGTKYSTPGTYTAANVDNGFDFANTTVAFAVVWEKKLVEDTVVVDFGLPVNIDVATNDFVYNSLTAIGTETPNADINTGTYEASALSTKIDTATGMSAELALGAHKAQIVNEKVVRFIPGSMEFNNPVTFNYETATDYYENSEVKTRYMYSKVTVIPATTIYYEDSFVTLESYSKGDDGTFTKANGTGAWTTEGTTVSATQAQDRPGESQISADLDADNNYGYDSAYTEMSTYSLGSAAKITVDAATRGEATFTFYGTGFDIIGLTSNTTGTLIVQLFEGASATGTAVKNLIVDTYYGYTQDTDGNWVISVNDPNALYQVPVMQMTGLEYKQYTVKLIAGYNKSFNHTAAENSYILYLDAVRIYDPTGNRNEVANGAYAEDGEAYPIYEELRDNVIGAGEVSDGNFYVKAEITEFAEDVTYYTRDNSGTYTAVPMAEYDANTTYYTLNKDDVYDVVETTDKFEDGVNYYVKHEVFEVADEYTENTTYYTQNEDNTYAEVGDLTEFADGVTYYVKKDTYELVYAAYSKTITYYIIVSKVNGLLFIDCDDDTADIVDYISYGPNNELYLAKNQAIAFNVTVSENVADIQLGIKVGNGDSVTYKINGDSYTVNTTTDMYYSILDYAKKGTVTIENVSGGILSLTNIKVTHTSAPVATTSLLWMDSESATAAVMSLRAASVDEEETTAPETTEPSESETTEPSEPETSEPETTEPETSEPETSVPEETKPENDREQVEEAVKEAVKNVINTVKNALKNLFSRWFR